MTFHLQQWWQQRTFLQRLLFFVGGCTVLGALLYWQRPTQGAPDVGSSLLIFLLVNLNIVILCVLLFLIARSVVKLIFDRRRRMLGSKLRLRLVGAFVVLTLVPLALLFTLASGLLSNAMQDWFSGQVENAVSGSVSLAKAYVSDQKARLLMIGRAVEQELRRNGGVTRQRPTTDEYLERTRQEEELFSLQLLRADGALVGLAQHPTAVIEDFAEPALDQRALDKAKQGEESSLFEGEKGTPFIRAYLPVRLGQESAVLIASVRVDADISHALMQVTESNKEYEQLKLFKNPLRSGYLLTLAMLTVLIFFAAIWFGLYLARELTDPLQKLAEGTRAVAQGNYDYRVPAVGDDELGLLVQSFNTMMGDLKLSRAELENRRLYMETILSRLAVGVLAFDRDGKLTAVNAAAATILGVPDVQAARGKLLHELISSDDFTSIRSLVEDVTSEGADGSVVREREISLQRPSQELRLVCTAGRIRDVSGSWLGTVLLIDDITELVKAQQTAVWRDAARRIAHEIKNPLTPIQLSAQRLEKLITEQGANPVVQDCVQTIVQHVDSIKRLANEFSRFARMPTAEFHAGSLNTLVSEVVSPYADAHPEVQLQVIADGTLPEILMDREQVRRILINLLDNAIAAFHGFRGVEPPRIMVRTRQDRKTGMVAFEVADNGPGVRETDKNRIFEPYFTTKEGGTGLGLAIVTSIVADHQGRIHVADNKPSGARFVVELPISQHAATQRRFVAGE